MVRQDIYGCISDDILGERGCTSSMKGKVKRIDVWINTDVARDGTCTFYFNKERKTVEMTCYIPKEWEVEIHRK